LIRLNAIRQVRPVIGLVRISMRRSTASPEGSLNRAETDRLSNVSPEKVMFGHLSAARESSVLEKALPGFRMEFRFQVQTG
jgi:hypothetical protein